jgi:hypothetical protein
MTPPHQHARHPKSYTSNPPIPLVDGMHPAPLRFKFGFEQVVAEPWVPCSDGVTSSDALPQQSQARPFVHLPLAIRLSEPQISVQRDER